MKVHEVIRPIEVDGWVLARVWATHRQYKHRVLSGIVTIPGKLSRDLPRGLERSILEQAGVHGDVMRDTGMPSYLIVIERAADGGYGAWAPDLPGCAALGDTLEECQRQMREAVAFHLEGLRRAGAPIPPPSAVAAAMVSVPAA